MAVFAIGTAPGLLALAGLPVVVPSTMRPTLLRLVGVVVIGFAFINASAGIRLAGVDAPLARRRGGGRSTRCPASGVSADGTQALTTFQDARWVQPGQRVDLRGDPDALDDRVARPRPPAPPSSSSPSLGIRVQLNEGSNTIDLPAMPPGTLAYSCSMGMYGGRITVVERPTGASGGSASGG